MRKPAHLVPACLACKDRQPAALPLASTFQAALPRVHAAALLAPDAGTIATHLRTAYLPAWGVHLAAFQPHLHFPA